MTSLYIWQYFLVVPESSVAAADAVSPYLSNPDGIEATFTRYPGPQNSSDAFQATEYSGPATHWVASFLATETASEGNPSKEMLEYYLSENSELSGILWVRTKNPHHPDTGEAEKGKIVATNWDVFDVGDTVDLNIITENIL